ncbi:MAG: translation elongation factor Ts [Acidobacteria bacterium]|nr:translation elongation factor Ts [Acidobacteriota bacterium]
MADVTADMIRDLRERTGAGMLDCKKALVESNGDMEEAVTILRKKGLAAANKKAGRITSEGLISIEARDREAAMVELNCETDFVARNDDFQALLQSLTKAILDNDYQNVEQVLDAKGPGGQTFREEISSKIAKIGENISLRRFERFEAKDDEVIGSYLHSNGRVGVLVKLKHEGGDAEEWKTVATDVAMHAAALDPRFTTRSEVTDDVLANERDIAKTQALASGRPAEFVDKIVSGKLEKWYQEVVLVEQEFVKDESKTVGKYVESKGKELGGKGEILTFTRFKLGEGLEKRAENFAEEVAKQVGA